MKNIYTLLITLLFFIISGYTISQEINFKVDKSNSFRIVNSDYSSLQFEAELVKLSSFSVKTKAGMFSRLYAESYGYTSIPGEPALPVLKKLIEVPLNCDFEITVSKVSYKQISLSDYNIENPLMPLQPPLSKGIDNPEDLPFIWNKTIYKTDEFAGPDLVTVVYLGTMRSVNMARIEFAPVSYNPVKNALKVCTHAEVEITFSGANTGQIIKQKQILFSPYFEGIYNQISNYKSEISDELIMAEPVTYIIISDPMFETALQPFIAWKVKKGFNVVEAYTNDPLVGATTISIKAYLQNFYDNPPVGYSPQSFVLLVGDVAQIPTFNGSAGSHVTDLYYFDYTGDIYPDCYYGRFSANNITQIQPQIDKTLEYEQYLMPDPTFLDEVLMVVGDDEFHEDTWGNGQINYGTQYYFNAAHGLYSHTYLQDPPTGNAAIHDSIIANINGGISYGNYSAHCSSIGWASPSFNIGDISSLNNAGMYPLLVGNCCLSVTFAGTCFGEEILRAANKGALGYIGGSNSTYWDEDYWWGVGYEAVASNPVYNAANLGAYDRTFHEHGEPLSEWYITQGQMPSAGDLAVTQSGSSLETYYWEIYHLMGDPSVMIWFSQPPVTTASYDPLMPLGAATFTVNTQPYAYVAISKDGILHGASVANDVGVAEVSLDPVNVPGTAEVVVTRQSGQPFVGTVTVASPTGPYLTFYSLNIDDAAGNNNGNADYSESILLDVLLENQGSSASTNVSVLLSTSDSYIILNDDSENWPDIPAGNSSSVSGAFGFNVAGDVPDQHSVDFNLEMTDGSETWNSQFIITINAPEFDAGFPVLEDAISGNGNNRIDPGETVEVSIVINNSGHSMSPLATAILNSSSPWITIISGNDDLGEISAQSGTTANFIITCDPLAPIGTSVDLFFEVNAGNYGYSTTYYQSVGLIAEEWETGDFSKFPWTMAGNADWIISSVNSYQGVYCAKSGSISNDQVSELSLFVLTTADDTISFYRKVSSEVNYDFLQFWVDGVKLEQWSGEVAWGKVSYFVEAGMHTLQWIYDKDVSISSGSDCSWIDYIQFPPIGPFTPDISIDPVFLDFGSVLLGETETMNFTITNSGSHVLIGTVSSPPAGYTVALANSDYKSEEKNTQNFVVGPGGSVDFVVLFSPVATICYNDNVLIQSNDPDQETLSLAVTGCGIAGPQISYDPDQFDKSIPIDNIVIESLSLINSGDADLSYTAQVVYISKEKVTATVYPESADYWTGTCTTTAKTENSLVKAYPTDEVGWMMFDLYNIPYLSTINNVEFHGFVNATNFPYWSMTPVSSNPIYTDPAALYTDIVAEATTGYYLHQNESSSYTTGWKSYTLPQIACNDLEYNLINSNRFIVGLVSRDTDPTYYINFDGWDEDNPPYLIVDYTYVPYFKWLHLDGQDDVSGTLAAGESDLIEVEFNTNFLTISDFEAQIVIISNDPANPEIVIPVMLHVPIPYEFGFEIALQGPYDQGIMNSRLVENGILPLEQPFNQSPWFYDGPEEITEPIDPDIVDWVLVELRTGATLEEATSDTKIAWQAALVDKYGYISSLNNYDQTLVFFDLPTFDDLWAVIWHRNHQGIISAKKFGNCFNGFCNYTFKTDTSLYQGGIGQINLGGGVFGMIAGDANADGFISQDDVNLWKSKAGEKGLNASDFNLDGEVNNIDKDDFLIPNLGSGCQVPE